MKGVKFILVSVGVLFLGACSSLPPQPQLPGDAQRHKQTQKMYEHIRAFHADSPSVEEPLPLRVVYVTPKDMKPKTGHTERINAYFNDFNLFFREEFKRNGLPPNELNLERNEDGTVKIYEVTGSKDSSAYGYRNGDLVRSDIQSALGSTFDPARNTLFIICAFSMDEPDSTIRIFSPFYGEYPFEARKSHGKAFLMDHELLNIDLIADTRVVKTFEHQRYKMTVSRFNKTYLGGALHELGHALGMRHNFKMNDEATLGEPLMGAGNYTYRGERCGSKARTYLGITEIAQLMAHPLFTRSMKGYDIFCKSKMEHFESSADSGVLRLKGQIKGEPFAPHAILVYVDPDQPPMDYDALNWVVIPDADGNFSISIPAEKISKCQWWLRFSLVYPNGSLSSLYYRFNGLTRQ